MRPVSGPELIRVLERRGWTRLRVNRSHHIFGKTGGIVRLSIPVDGKSALKTGLLRHMMKLANLSEADFS